MVSTKKKKERTEAVARRCSIKKVFLEILQNSQESDWARLPPAYNFILKEALPQLLSCEFCKISKNTFYCRTPPVEERKFFKLAFKLKLTSVESVKTARVRIAFFFHHFKHYGWNSGVLFNRLFI